MNNTDSVNNHCEPKGNCFPAAFDTLSKMMDDAESNQFLLVHGNVARLPQDEEVNHAWVEDESTVYDNSNGIHSEKEKAAYYEQLKISATRKYKLMDAMKLNIQHGNSGPWPL